MTTKTTKIATTFNTYAGPLGSGGPRLVIMESPFRADNREQLLENVMYARRCLKDCLDRGEAPIASHLLYTQVLDDADPKQRQRGIESGLAWMRVAHASVIYTDLGISEGMRKAIEMARLAGVPTEMRTLT